VSGTFDIERWRSQSWLRFQRKVKRTKKKSVLQKAEAQWFREVQCIEMIRVVVEWAATRGTKVVFSKRANGVYKHDLKEIVISAHAHPERQLHYLLHECGHHLIGMKEHHERFGVGYPLANDPEVNRKFLHRMACLEEEFEAWHRGWKLARRLGLPLNKETFDSIKSECISTYVKWAAKNASPSE